MALWRIGLFSLLLFALSYFLLKLVSFSSLSLSELLLSFVLLFSLELQFLNLPVLDLVLHLLIQLNLIGLLHSLDNAPLIQLPDPLLRLNRLLRLNGLYALVVLELVTRIPLNSLLIGDLPFLQNFL